MFVRGINLAEKLALVDERWAPQSVAALNDYEIKVVKVSGEFVWHEHAHTDELVLVLSPQEPIRSASWQAPLPKGSL